MNNRIDLLVAQNLVTSNSTIVNLEVAGVKFLDP